MKNWFLVDAIQSPAKNMTPLDWHRVGFWYSKMIGSSSRANVVNKYQFDSVTYSKHKIIWNVTASGKRCMIGIVAVDNSVNSDFMSKLSN